MKKYQCPCCRYYTFESDFGDGPLFDYCEVCGWQYDPVAHDKPDALIGANHITLNEARENYKKFGASKKSFIETNRVRKPLLEELPENNQ